MKNSRRNFLKKTALASSIAIVPRHVLGGVGYTAPSDQLAIAAIGIGGKGRTDLNRAYVDGGTEKLLGVGEHRFSYYYDKIIKTKRERIVALCDVDPMGKHGVTESRKRFPEANFYEDFRVLLDKEKDVDAVIISTPDHTHAVIAMDAMQRGKHVYVQKPLTHNIREARMLTETARKQKVVTQMGNQGASGAGRVKVQEWVDNKLIGNIREVKVWTNRPVWPQGIPIPTPKEDTIKSDSLNWDLWLGPAQDRPYAENIHPFNWRGWWEYGTGALGDMGCHLMDTPFVTLGLKYPTDVESSIGSVYKQMWTPEYIPEACPPSSMITLGYEASEKNPVPLKLTWTDGGIKPPHPDLLPVDEEIPANGVLMIGEKGVISCGVYCANPKLFRKGEPTLKLETPKEQLEAMGNVENKHQRHWVEACKAGFNSDQHKKLTSSFDSAGPLTEGILMGNISIRSHLLRKETERGYKYPGRKKLLWDGENMKITNFEEANQFISRTYRKGWEI